MTTQLTSLPRSSVFFSADNVSKVFPVKTQTVTAVHEVSLAIEKGEFVVIFGPSGCGKSTLLHILLGLEHPSRGVVKFMGKELYASFDDDARAELRKRHIGIVYQQSNWIQALSVEENVMFPLNLNGIEGEEARRKTHEVLGMVGMRDHAQFSPTELSSGQQQKIALARAIITNPEIIVADEPTGNLDFESGQDLMKLLYALNKEGKTVVMVTHDLEYLKYAQRALRMFDGKLVERIDDPEHERKINAEMKRGVHV